MMCGLAGILGGETPDRSALQRALDAIEHRGPDELRIWTQDGVGLAHARLSIIDRAHGSQPVVSADGRYVVVFNGEIYNHHELRRDLVTAGYPLRTACDTEILPYLYAAEGPAMVERLRGMFAFAVVDLHEREVFLARDGFGKKPLYVAPAPGSVAFASTLDGLLPLLPSAPDLDPQTIAEYLVLQYVPDARSPWRGVEKVLPGTWLRWGAGRLESGRYWTPPSAIAADRAGEVGDVRSELRVRIRAAVERRLESEVPLGVFLSGGLDSSVVVAEMAALGHRAKTYSVGFHQDGLDERPFAQMVASRFDTDHHVLVPDDDVLALFGHLTSAYDEPFADSSALATLAVAQAAKEHVTVVLTGDGGDELFGGYDRYRALALGRRIGSGLGPLARPAVSIANAAARLTGVRKLSAASAFVRDPWAGYRDHLFHFTPEEVRTLMPADGADPWAAVRRLDERWRAAGETDPWVPWVDAQTYLPDDLLTKMDRATMAFGVEARSPLLDEDLWAYVARLPRAMLLDHRVGKKIMRAAYRDVLPEPILKRSKQGFGVPIASWMRSQLRPALDDLLLGPHELLGGLLAPGHTRRLVSAFLGGNDRLAARTWNLLALAGWHETRTRAGSLAGSR
jgi:asparagine synthase (glutamine-hydrolysing)